ncbi:DUF1684 domain-containing protein [Devosia sp.]|uniref:DUF1684 domain-containing protein n=1 Tax=Devosia sp. TaxID=1871048 RepID=UPI001AC34383|nr:DUF1684 domain-containing protein [Devosia sp.]MBN9308872.1 DUF1684 domain-containing protein [Devosia sp.]
MTTQANYPAELEAWKERRMRNLKAPNGWLNIIGRYWLEQGSVTVGSAADNDIVLAAGPAHVGTITEDETGVTFAPADGGTPLRLQLNKQKPPQFDVGSLLLEVTTMNGENALRVRDKDSKGPAAFPGIEYFPIRPEWRIVADWVPFEQELTVNTSHNIPTDVVATHKAVFTHDGKSYELIATHGTPEAPQFVIRDLTSRDSTYGACRFVYGEDVTETSIVLDFNKAINPPCAFTEHAVCPLPPAQNVLPFRIEAGEKRVDMPLA